MSSGFTAPISRRLDSAGDLGYLAVEQSDYTNATNRKQKGGNQVGIHHAPNLVEPVLLSLSPSGMVFTDACWAGSKDGCCHWSSAISLASASLPSARGASMEALTPGKHLLL